MYYSMAYYNAYNTDILTQIAYIILTQIAYIILVLSNVC